MTQKTVSKMIMMVSWSFYNITCRYTEASTVSIHPTFSIIM